ncbi:MAG: carboxylating nicotinate-nucleotide diphosphorylase [Candidatus Bathyarchaeia archaeon]
MELPKTLLREKLLEFLREDIGMGDVTSEAIAPVGARVEAQIITKEPCVVAGLYEVKKLFEMFNLEIVRSVSDGDEVDVGTVIAEILGDSRAVLTAERTALNILVRMSGIATATRRLLSKVNKQGRTIRIAATRKTAPGLRYFDKRAVAIGGGDTHRFRLDDAVLIKDNHIVVAGGVENALRRVRSTVSFAKKVEIEVKKPEEALKAAQLGVDIVMLDNMTPEKVRESMEILKQNGLRDKVLIEVSGGVTEENITDYAETGPDIISLGSLTHSVKAVDMSLEIVKVL